MCIRDSLGAGRSKDVAYHRDIHHALADKAADGGFMAGSPLGDDGDPVGALQLVVDHSILAVSYTHLDVYKRQGQ